MTKQDLAPESIIVGLARLGSIIAIIRALMSVMAWINQRQFERKITKFMHREKAEGLQESEVPDGSSLAGDIYRRKKFNIQDDEEINVNDNLLNESTTLSQNDLPKVEETDIKKRYSIEMFEDLIQTVAKMKLQISKL
jgi:hypothetical protein